MNLIASAGESRLIHCQPRNQNYLMTAYGRNVGRTRRLSHPAVCRCLMDANASYQAYKFRAIRRPDKAFTPHPAVVQMPDATLTRLIRPTNSRATRRPDKAFTPHPAVVADA